MKLAFKAIDQQGRAVNDVMDAAGISEALELLRRDGYMVTDLREAGSAALSRKARRERARSGGRMRRKKLMFFTRQMAMLLKAGSPIVPALAAISKQLRPGPRAVLDRMRQDMEQGMPLADTMRGFPETFSDTYTAIIAAGEQSANLPGMFTRMADLVTYHHRLRNRVLAALAYPCLLMGLSAAILLTMILFVVPRFAELFQSLGATMPWSTRMMFAVSQLVRGHSVAVGAVVVVLLLSAVVAVRSRGFRQWACNMQTRVPLLGRLTARLIQAQMFRVMGVLLESRVAMMEVLLLGRQVTRNQDFQTLCNNIHDQVEQGKRFSDAMLNTHLISPSIAQAISTGEEAGHLEQALQFVSDVLDEENSQILTTATKLLEPAILILMGTMVGGIAMSLFVPLFDLAATSG